MEFYQSPRMRVANAIMAELAKADLPPMIVEGFVNGREQGLSVSDYSCRASFGEDRNTDLITLQFGKTHDFSAQGNVLYSQGLTNTAFRTYTSTPAEAAKLIVTFFLENSRSHGIAPEEHMPYTLPCPPECDNLRNQAQAAGYTVHGPGEGSSGWSYCIDGDYSREWPTENEAWGAALADLQRR